MTDQNQPDEAPEEIDAQQLADVLSALAQQHEQEPEGEEVAVPIEAFGKHVPATAEGGMCVQCSTDGSGAIEWPCEYARMAANGWALRGMFEGITEGMESPAMQIDRLGNFIIQTVPGEPSRPEGAIDCAIRLLGVYEGSLPHHIANIDKDGSWTIQHPLSCRPRLFDCLVNRVMEQTEDLRMRIPESGTYVVALDDEGALTIGERVSA